ncbi:ribosomal protein L28 [Capsaspora owczarzaki ATCC 30864]|uniref:Ribosomal protein L28 n=2 Tax=Capsaspora owczarzaki (strain ATCC 30864) TaxID=595528 RepID=A0A0D2WGW9_CAPO3|nr:ribosomal protein L28 [Capsaspora owczarzaki ATCC 30864]
MSSDVQWMVIRNNSSFLLKKAGVTFSTEAGNLTGKNSFKANGLVNKRSVGVKAAADGKGVVVTLRNDKKSFKPTKATRSVTLKKGSRAALATVKALTEGQNYRADLTHDALRLTSALFQSQKTRKTAGVKKARSRKVAKN